MATMAAVMAGSMQLTANSQVAETSKALRDQTLKCLQGYLNIEQLSTLWYEGVQDQKQKAMDVAHAVQSALNQVCQMWIVRARLGAAR